MNASILANRDLSVVVSGALSTTSSELLAGRTLQIRGGTLANTGVIGSADTLNIDAHTIDN